MIHEQKINQILVKNEDWIISKILSSAKQYTQHESRSLINFGWKQTVSNLSALLLNDFQTIKPENAISNIRQSEGFEYTTYARNAVNMCRQSQIEAHVFLSFLKVVRGTYEELICEGSLPTSQKTSFFRQIDKSFDCIEVAFIRLWSASANKANEVSQSPYIDSHTYNSLFESLPLPCIMVDTFHRVVKHNKEARLFIPSLFERETGKLNRNIRIREKESLHAKIDEFRISKHEQSNFEVSLTTDDKDYYVLIGLRKLRASAHILVSFIDLTTWKKREQDIIEEKNRLKANRSEGIDYLANISHEIRTPVNAIVGFSELLSTVSLPEKSRMEYMNMLKKSSNDLLGIIEDVMDLAKIESRKLKISYKDSVVSEWLYDLKQVYETLIHRQSDNKVKLLLYIPENEKDFVISTDPKRVKQVLSNLIGNALKFTEKGTIEIGYKLSSDNLIYFFVKDTGIGVPYTMQSKIFDRYAQVDSIPISQNAGSGLGLAISKNLVSMLGGNLAVSSTPGRGSIFYFYLPCLPGKPKPEISVAQSSPLRKAISLASKTLLIAEDEDANFLYIKEALRPTGAGIIRANTGAEAIQLAENNQSVDLILMDIKMPELNGIDATKYIKHIRPDLPIIAISAHAMENDKETCLQAGCNAYLSKPVSYSELIFQIKKVLSLKSVVQKRIAAGA